MYDSHIFPEAGPSPLTEQQMTVSSITKTSMIERLKNSRGQTLYVNEYPVQCCTCHRFKLEDGSFEEEPTVETNVPWSSHGLCDDCCAKYRETLGLSASRSGDSR
jgi:hypothetical protein